MKWNLFPAPVFLKKLLQMLLLETSLSFSLQMVETLNLDRREGSKGMRSAMSLAFVQVTWNDTMVEEIINVFFKKKFILIPRQSFDCPNRMEVLLG